MMNRSVKSLMVSVFALAIFSAAGIWVSNQKVNADVATSASTNPSASSTHNVNCAELEKTKDTSQADNDTYDLRCSGKYSAKELAAFDNQTPTPEEESDGPKDCEDLQKQIDSGLIDPINACSAQATTSDNTNATTGITSCDALKQLADQGVYQIPEEDYKKQCVAQANTINSDNNTLTTDQSVAQPRSKAPLHWAILITDAIIVLGLFIALTVRVLGKILSPDPTTPQFAAPAAAPSGGQPKTIDDLHFDLQ